MKTKLTIIITILVIGAISLFTLWKWNTSAISKITQRYDILFREKLADGQMLYGLSPKAEGTEPSSLIAIYDNNDVVYKFSPVAPEAAGYPRPLALEKGWVAGDVIITAWGETGADYFGTHPLAFAKIKGKWRAVNFYDGGLCNDPRIRRISWTRPDFYVKNYFDNTDRAKTILTQGVEVVDGKVELLFYGDELPRAAEHDFVRILMPLN